MACAPYPGGVRVSLCSGLTDLVSLGFMSDREDRPKLKIPKSFDQLKELNTLLKKYKTIYPFRTVLCFVIVYLLCVFPFFLFLLECCLRPEVVSLTSLNRMCTLSLQAFSLPGSMYLSILGGAVWGMARALPLCCAVRSLLLFLPVSVSAASYFTSFSEISPVGPRVLFTSPLHACYIWINRAACLPLPCSSPRLLVSLTASPLWLLGLILVHLAS